MIAPAADAAWASASALVGACIPAAATAATTPCTNGTLALEAVHGPWCASFTLVAVACTAAAWVRHAYARDHAWPGSYAVLDACAGAGAAACTVSRAGGGTTALCVALAVSSCAAAVAPCAIAWPMGRRTVNARARACRVPCALNALVGGVAGAHATAAAVLAAGDAVGVASQTRTAWPLTAAAASGVVWSTMSVHDGGRRATHISVEVAAAVVLGAAAMISEALAGAHLVAGLCFVAATAHALLAMYGDEGLCCQGTALTGRQCVQTTVVDDSASCPPHRHIAAPP